MAFFLLKRQNY